MKRLLSSSIAALLMLGVGVAAQNRNDWPTVGNDAGGMKFSPLAQITPANVSQLTPAWTYDTGDPATGRGYSITPIVIGNVMYLPVRGSTIVALKADSGTELWTSDLAEVPGLGANPSAGTRGISYWPGTAGVGPRIVIAITNGYLVQLDAKTGAPVPAPAGVINLNTDLGDPSGAAYSTNMPPAIYRNTAIVAGRTGEQGRYGTPGDPRAFDLTTGKELWRFHVVPRPGEENFGTWGINGWQDRRGPGIWSPVTVDEANGLVFFPLGNATDQNFGGHRPGENHYAGSLLVLDAQTGKRKWHFQHTRHDIFDWDSSAPPALIDGYLNGERVPAVAQLTKQGLLFMFHRITGQPLFGIEERPVPYFDAPGDAAWPVQPFPVKPTGLARDSMARTEVTNISPESRKYCTELYDKSVHMGPFTPYGMLPTLVFPGSEGGGNWGGVSANPQLDLLFVNTRDLGVIAQLQPSTSSGVLPSFAKSKVPTNFYVDQQGYPCSAPPWSQLIAVSTRTGDVVWRAPLGEYPELAARGITGTGTASNHGAPIATGSGLLFIGSSMDFSFRAFDARSGKEIWKATLDNDVVMTPMTYQGANGKQYVVAVSSGGQAEQHLPRRTGPAPNAKVVAFALP